MLKYIAALFSLFSVSNGLNSREVSLVYGSLNGLSNVSNNCVSFSVSVGTGCAWMCNYCANQLGTNNYYFTDNICTYQSGGCVGNPSVGVSYTCCSV